MSVKKALEGLDILIETKKEIASVILELLCKWGTGTDDIATRNGKMIFRSVQKDLEWLILGSGEDWKKYTKMTKVETIVPFIFCGLYIALSVGISII